MIRTVLEFLSRGIQGAPLVAVSVSFLWGVLSILLSPCHLSSIPLIVGFINGQGKITTRRAFGLAGLFSIGILITITLIGIITSVFGRMAGDIGSLGNYIVAVIFFVVGLYLLEVIPLPFLGRSSQPAFKKKGFLASFILGLLFGIALGPCTFAYMAPMLAVAFKVASTQFLYAVILLLVYGIGHCSVIVLAGTFMEVVQHYLNWTEKSRGAVLIKKICGVLVILGGIYLIWNA